MTPALVAPYSAFFSTIFFLKAPTSPPPPSGYHCRYEEQRKERPGEAIQSRDMNYFVVLEIKASHLKIKYVMNLGSLAKNEKFLKLTVHANCTGHVY
jgi:hypothetical protein